MTDERKPTYEEAIDALERIALLDECDGHELAVRHAFKAVEIATKLLGKHPSVIFSERYEREQRAKGFK